MPLCGHLFRPCNSQTNVTTWGGFKRHARGTVDAVALIKVQPKAHAAAAFQGVRPHGALYRDGPIRVRGIAQEGHARGAPGADRLAVVDRPAVTLVVIGGIEDHLDLRMPAGIVDLQFLPGPALGERFVFSATTGIARSVALARNSGNLQCRASNPIEASRLA